MRAGGHEAMNSQRSWDSLFPGLLELTQGQLTPDSKLSVTWQPQIWNQSSGPVRNQSPPLTC